MLLLQGEFLESNLPLMPSNSMNRAVRTRDMGGNSTTHEFTRAVLDKM